MADRGFLMGVSIISIVESMAVLLTEALDDDVFVGGLCAIQLVGLRVPFSYIRSLFVVGVVPHNSYSSLFFNHS